MSYSEIMVVLKQINKQIVKAIPLEEEDTRPIKGFDICEILYANIFLCAKKNSGKTSVINKIIKECCVKKTILYIFCSTIYKDVNWIAIRKRFEKKGMEINVFTSIMENGEDQLQKLIDQLGQEAQDEEQDEDKSDDPPPYVDPCDEIIKKLACMASPANPTGTFPSGNCQEELKEPKKRKSKYRAPEYMIIFDDLAGELKSTSLLDLLKKNRHYKTKIIISSQWINDLLPQSRKQIDLFLIFKGFADKKMNEIHRDCDTAAPLEQFIEIYKQATEKPFSFLYIDARSDKFRCNFDKQFILDE